MPRCPECEEELTEIAFTATKTVSWGGTVVIDLTNGTPTLKCFQDWDSEAHEAADNHKTEFECPECGATLAKTDEEAIKFLQGKKDRTKAEE